jgi:RNA polymerase subunit RPABC4/transcription elongation factor Spt4
MDYKELYEEETCPNCGQRKLKIASFCPHCGHVRKEGGWSRIWEELKAGASRPETGQASPAVVSVVVGVIVAGIVLYQLFVNRSYEGIVTALIALFLLLQALWRARKGRREKEEAGTAGDESVATVEEDNSSEGVGPGQHVFCEECGMEVGADATVCPKCGLRFGDEAR